MKLGYTLVYVDDVKSSLDFYSKAFGLETGFLHESLQYGEMKTGDTKLGFVDHETAKSHGFEYTDTSSLKNPAGFEIGFVTSDVPAAYQKAIQAGAKAISAPKTKPWGQVVSYVQDCNGILIEICSPMG